MRTTYAKVFQPIPVHVTHCQPRTILRESMRQQGLPFEVYVWVFGVFVLHAARRGRLGKEKVLFLHGLGNWVGGVPVRKGKGVVGFYRRQRLRFSVGPGYGKRVYGGCLAQPEVEVSRSTGLESPGGAVLCHLTFAARLNDYFRPGRRVPGQLYSQVVVGKQLPGPVLVQQSRFVQPVDH